MSTTKLASHPPRFEPESGAPREDRFLAEFGGVWSRIGGFQRTRMSWIGLAHLLRHARDVIERGVPGDYAEFGTWRCGSLFAVARAWEKFGAADRSLLGFDSFEGLPPPSEPRDGPWLRKGVFSDVDFGEIERFFADQGLSNRVTLVRGWFDRTIGRLDDHRLALLHIDADLYDSVKCALEAGWERLSPGGVVVFDDYRHPDCAGCTIAVEEFFASRPEVVQTQAGTNYSSFVIKSESSRTIVAAHGTKSQTKWRPTVCTEASARGEADGLRARLLDRCAAWCARSGFQRIALFGAGRHTRPITRQPWVMHGIEVVAIVDDEPRTAHIGGVPVFRPAELDAEVDAVVISSECYEDRLAARAHEVFDPRGIPVVRIYSDERPAQCVLLREHGVSAEDAGWLGSQGVEQADPTLPMLAPAQSEMMLRRYDLAAMFTRGTRVLDLPCGTGFGSTILMGAGRAGSYIGIDADERAAGYARRRFAGTGRAFLTRELASTGVDASSIDAAVVDLERGGDVPALIAELARVLRRDALLVIHGEASGVRHDACSHLMARVLPPWFQIERWLGQVEGDSPAWPDLPPGIFPVGDGPVPSRVIAIARRTGEVQASAAGPSADRCLALAR